jgi:hypothetical protein
MGMRSGTTFKKRQKELARMEKQRDKAARRVQRKAEKLDSPNGLSDDLGEPLDGPAPIEGMEPPEVVTVPARE